MKDLTIEKTHAETLQLIERMTASAHILSTEAREHLDYEYKDLPVDYLLRNYTTVRACVYGLESILEALTEAVDSLW